MSEHNFVMISYSDDGGHTWSHEIKKPLLQDSRNYLFRVILRRQGSAYDRRYRLRYSENKPFTLVRVDQWRQPIPDKLLEDPAVAEYFRSLQLLLDDLTRPEGAVATSTATTEVVLTQQEKLDLMTITQNVNLDTVEADTATNKTAVDLIATGSPDYSISNDGTDRSFDADDAAGSISVNPTQAEVENIRDAVLVHGDVLATIIRDLKNKGVFGV
jgi:hypothetical protein